MLYVSVASRRLTYNRARTRPEKPWIFNYFFQGLESAWILLKALESLENEPFWKPFAIFLKTDKRLFWRRFLMTAKVHNDHAFILWAQQCACYATCLHACYYTIFVIMFYLACVGPGNNNFWALRGLEKALNFVLPKVYEPWYNPGILFTKCFKLVIPSWLTSSCSRITRQRGWLRWCSWGRERLMSRMKPLSADSGR